MPKSDRWCSRNICLVRSPCPSLVDWAQATTYVYKCMMRTGMLKWEYSHARTQAHTYTCSLFRCSVVLCAMSFIHVCRLRNSFKTVPYVWFGLHVTMCTLQRFLLVQFWCKLVCGYGRLQVFLNNDRRELSRVPGVTWNNTAMTPLTSALFCLDESQRLYKYMSKKNGPRLEKRAVNTQVYHVGCGFWVWIGQWLSRRTAQNFGHMLSIVYSAAFLSKHHLWALFLCWWVLPL